MPSQNFALLQPSTKTTPKQGHGDQCRPKHNRALASDDDDGPYVAAQMDHFQAARFAARRRAIDRQMDDEVAFGEGPPFSTADLELGRTLIDRDHKSIHLAEQQAGFYQGDILVPASAKGIADAVGGDWPSCKIPYSVSNYMSNEARGAIAAGLELISNTTCIRFVPKTESDVDYIMYKSDTGCYSDIGRSGGRQPISIGAGCEKPGIAAHETLHALGFFHEQSRSDRDEYITINWPQIEPGSACHNFFKEDFQLISKYDYMSLMHYPRRAFSRDKSDEPTITTKDPKYDKFIGQRTRLSSIDIQRLCDKFHCAERDCFPELGYNITDASQ